MFRLTSNLTVPFHPSLYAAVTATGIIWSRYSFVITPVNYNLFSVNAFMAVTGSYQLWRKFSAPATPAASS